MAFFLSVRETTEENVFYSKMLYRFSTVFGYLAVTMIIY